MKRSIMYVLAILSLLCTCAHAQLLRLTIDGAISKATGEYYNQFNWGFAAGGHLLYYLNSHILVGARTAYIRYTPNESNFIDNTDNLLIGDVDGYAYIIEAVPSIRVTTNFTMNPINFFAQGGAGVFIVNDKVTVSDPSEGDPKQDETFGEGARGRFGFSLGGGISFGTPEHISVDLLPLFNIVFLGDNVTLNYFTFNLGLAFGI